MQYMLFLPSSVCVYFLLPHTFRSYFLLMASYGFYMYWKAEYVAIILIITILGYGAGLLIGNDSFESKRKYIFPISIIGIIGFLLVFKYANFFIGNVNHLFLNNLQNEYSAIQLILPLGISFYTFQALSYVIDVYKRQRQAERNIVHFALYITFFPQLFAGPITRSSTLLPQIKTEQSFNYERFVDGLILIAWGLLKKAVIADRIATVIEPIFNHPRVFSSTALFISAVFYSYQIYCDFSGYSDIAIGSAKLFGYDLMWNFKTPYHARSLREFWQRWHISLSTWFRDYVYIPLGGNRVTKARRLWNLFITFFLSGLWHGANWTFVVWGMIHGLLLITGILLSGVNKRVAALLSLHRVPRFHSFIQKVYTFLLVTFAWIFFRADSVKDAWRYINYMFKNTSGSHYLDFNIDTTQVFVIFVYILFLEVIQNLQKNDRLRAYLVKRSPVVRWSFYLVILLSVILVGKFGDNKFIYFKF